jgi:hypothetical protein
MRQAAEKLVGTRLQSGEDTMAGARRLVRHHKRRVDEEGGAGFATDMERAAYLLIGEDVYRGALVDAAAAEVNEDDDEAGMDVEEAVDEVVDDLEDDDDADAPRKLSKRAQAKALKTPSGSRSSSAKRSSRRRSRRYIAPTMRRRRRRRSPRRPPCSTLRRGPPRSSRRRTATSPSSP